MEQQNELARFKTPPKNNFLRNIIILAIIVLIFFVILPMFRPGHPPAHGIRCRSNLKHFALAIHLYNADNSEDENNTASTFLLPTSDKWNDLTVDYLGNDRVYMCPLEKRAPKTCTYVLNKNLYDIKGPIQTPATMVLAFEGQVGWNQTGGPEDMVFRHGKEGNAFCNVAFADGHVEQVRKDQATNLKWKPED